MKFVYVLECVHLYINIMECTYVYNVCLYVWVCIYVYLINCCQNMRECVKCEQEQDPRNSLLYWFSTSSRYSQ